MPPAIKGVKQAHFAFLALPGQGLDNGAHQHLQQPAAQGAQRRGGHQPRVGRKQRGQKGQAQQAQAGENVRPYRAGAIPDAIHKFGGQHVYQHLNRKIHGDNQADLRKREGEFLLKGDEQQGRKIVDDSLDDIAHIAGQARMAVGQRLHTNAPLNRRIKYAPAKSPRR